MDVTFTIRTISSFSLSFKAGSPSASTNPTFGRSRSGNRPMQPLRRRLPHRRALPDTRSYHQDRYRGSTYNMHNPVLELVPNCASSNPSAPYSIWLNVRRCPQHRKLPPVHLHELQRRAEREAADIAFLDVSHSAFNAQRVYGDVTHRAVVGMSAGTPAACGQIKAYGSAWRNGSCPSPARTLGAPRRALPQPKHQCAHQTPHRGGKLMSHRGEN